MDEIEKWQRSRKKHKSRCKCSRFLDIDIPVTAWPNTNTRNTRVNYKTIMESIPTCNSMSNRKVLRGAGIVGIFTKVRFQPWIEIWSFYHLKIWGSFCDTFGWTWHEQSFHNIKHKYKPRYDYIWIGNLFSVELNVRDLALAPKLHGEHILVPANCIVYIGYSRNLDWFWAFGWQTWCRQVEARSPVWERTERLYGLERDCLKLLHCRIIVCVLHCWPLFYDTGKGLLNILFGSCESIAFKVWAPDGQSGNWQRYTTSFSQSVFLKVFKSTAADIWNNLTEVFW